MESDEPLCTSKPTSGRWPYAMSANEAAEYCGISATTLRRLVERGLAPAPFRIPTGSKRQPVLWHRKALEEWLDNLARRSPDAATGGPTRRHEHIQTLRSPRPRPR